MDGRTLRYCQECADPGQKGNLAFPPLGGNDKRILLVKVQLFQTTEVKGCISGIFHCLGITEKTKKRR